MQLRLHHRCPIYVCCIKSNRGQIIVILNRKPLFTLRWSFRQLLTLVTNIARVGVVSELMVADFEWLLLTVQCVWQQLESRTVKANGQKNLWSVKMAKLQWLHKYILVLQSTQFAYYVYCNTRAYSPRIYTRIRVNITVHILLMTNCTDSMTSVGALEVSREQTCGSACFTREQNECVSYRWNKYTQRF